MQQRVYSISETAAAFGLAVSALRYYEDRGLLSPTERRGRVRYYDRAALEQLAYLQLWHEDGLLSLADTAEVIATDDVAERRTVILAQRDAMRERIRRLSRAAAVLDHMLQCRTDQPLECPMTGAHIRARVDAALSGTDLDDDFLPSYPADDDAQAGRGAGHDV